MNTQKTVIIMLACVLCAFAVESSFAQERAFEPGQILSDLKARLQLTEEQIAQLRPIMQNHSDRLRALIEQYKGQGITGLKSLQEELAPLRDEVNTRLGPILTETQKQELQAFYEELRDTVNETIRERIIAELSERLELAEEQAEQLLPILRDNIEQRRELVEKLREQGRDGFQAFREGYQALQETTTERMKAILNAEQLRKIEAYQEELREKIRQEILERRKN